MTWYLEVSGVYAHHDQTLIDSVFLPVRIGGRVHVKVDLHSHGKWRSQLSLLRVLQSLQDGFRQASSTPTADLLVSQAGV